MNRHRQIDSADRINQIEEYYFSRKLKEIDAISASGKNVINLGLGNPSGAPHQDVIDIICFESNKAEANGYQSYKGISELRESFSIWYKDKFNVDLDSENEILPLIGSKEGILHISLAFLNPGDGVLVPNPGYPTYKSVSRLLGVNVQEYKLKENNLWYPDFEKLEELIDLRRIKLMWVNYPHMPTGAPASRKLFEKLVRFGNEHKILICNDNPYSFINNKIPISILSIDGSKDCCMEMNSLSNSHNMAGWRMGMLAGQKLFINFVLKAKSNIDSGMFKPLELATVKALNLQNKWYNTLNQVYSQRRIYGEKILKLIGCSYNKNQVGMFLWAKTPPHLTDEELVDKCLYEGYVYIAPGFIFGSQGEGYIRISLSSRLEDLENAYTRLQEIFTS